MQFFEWDSQYHKMKRAMKSDRMKIESDIDRWYHDIIRDYRGLVGPLINDPRPGNSIIQLCTEREWFRSGRPYYKVFPQMASMMAEVSINIPVCELNLPYRAFTIHLCQGDENDFCENGWRLKSLLISETDVTRNTDGTFKTSLDTVGLATGADRAFRIGYEFEGPDNQFDYTMSLHGGDRLLEDEFQESWDFSWPEAQKQIGDEWAPSKELVSKIIRLSIAVCFFGIDCHEVVMPDLPRRVVEQHAWKKRMSYNDAFRSLSTELKKQAKQWTIGNEIVLPTPIVNRSDKEPGGGQERSHAYMRRGHMRWQPCGPGRKERDLIFVHPHLCRPDLPIGKSHGYRIPDDQLEEATR